MTNSKVVILDGGMSRELVRLGAPFRQPEWSAHPLLEAPHFVRQVHDSFARCGADVITTNSYALVPFHIGEDRFRERGRELAALAGRLAREAAEEEGRRIGRNVLVAGSLPPIFGSYEPERFDGAKVQEYLSVLIEGMNKYVDFWLGETLSLIKEAEAVATVVKEQGKPFWIAFTIDDSDENATALSKPRLRSGQSVADAAHWLLASEAEGLLFNCSRPEFLTAAVREAKAVFSQKQERDISIGVYANAFEPKPETYAANANISKTRDDLSIEMYVSFAREWVVAGAVIIGGCCGIGHEYVERLAQVFGENAP